MDKLAFILIILFIQGCASVAESISVNQIKAGDTLIAGSIIFKKKRYISGVYSREETIPTKKAVIALRQFKSVSEVPELYLSLGDNVYSTKGPSFFLFPIQPSRYFLAETQANTLIPVAFGYTGKSYGKIAFLAQPFATASAEGTIQMDIKANVVNYIGDIHVVETVESYRDLNHDGFIEKDEFKSAFVTFEDLAKGYDEISLSTKYSNISISVVDNFSESNLPKNTFKNIAKYVKFNK